MWPQRQSYDVLISHEELTDIRIQDLEHSPLVTTAASLLRYLVWVCVALCSSPTTCLQTIILKQGLGFPWEVEKENTQSIFKDSSFEQEGQESRDVLLENTKELMLPCC